MFTDFLAIPFWTHETACQHLKYKNTFVFFLKKLVTFFSLDNYKHKALEISRPQVIKGDEKTKHKKETIKKKKTFVWSMNIVIAEGGKNS